MSPYTKEFFKQILDSMHDLVLVKGQKSRLLWANQAFLNYYGMTEDELYDIIDGPQSNPDDTLQYVRDDQKVFDSKVDLIVPEETVTDSKGRSRIFNTIKSPIFENQEVIRTVGVSRLVNDPTVPKLDVPHEEAKSFTAPLRSITLSFPVPMALLDTRGRIVNCSPSWAKIFDPLEDSQTAHFFSDSYPQLEALNQLFDRTLESPEIQTHNLSIGEGPTLKHFAFNMGQWQYPNGDLGGTTITATDISKIIETNQQLDNALKRAEEAEKRTKEAKFNVRALLDYSRNFIGVLSPEGRLLDANKTALKTAGIAESEVLNKFFWETPWWNHSKSLQKKLEKAINNVALGNRAGFEAVHLTPDGKKVIVDFSLAPIFDENSKVIGIVPEGINITEQKERERQIQKFSQQLQNTNAMLKKSYDDLDEFSYAASHDLKSPLRVIGNLATWLLEDYHKNLPEVAQTDLKKITERAKNLDEMLDALLHYSRMGRDQEEDKQIDLKTIVKEEFEMLDKPDSFQLELAPDLPLIRARPTPLRAVLRNLIDNAIKHHERDNGRVKVSCKKHDNHYKIAVSDDGPGIPQGQEKKIFRIFRTLTPKDRGSSSGVGLAIANKAILKEGGEINVENNAVGKGATFIFTWPIDAERK